MSTSKGPFQQRILSQQQRTLQHFTLGEQGENKAVEFLLKKKYQILERNLRLKNNEVDIIALDTEKSELVFCEVKTRTTDFFGDPSQAVTHKKILSMQKVAREYLQKLQWRNGYRFDVVTVLPNSVEHFENITW